MRSKEDYFIGMSEQDIIEYKEAEQKMIDDRNKQYAKDVAIIRYIKKQVPRKIFRAIVSELYGSEHWSNIRIVDKPTGNPQNDNWGNKIVWVDQYTEFEDCYSGYIYIELPNGKYFAWDYYC